MKYHISCFLAAVLAIAPLTACSDDDDESSVPVSSVALDPVTATLTVGETIQITAAVAPADADDKTVVWASADPETATVDNNGNVTAVAPGQTSVTATAGNITARCRIKVNPVNVSAIELIPEELKMMTGQTVRLIALLTPENPTYPTIQWASTDESVVTVSADGDVTAISAGQAYITAMADDMFATCHITVTTPASVGDIYYTDGTTSSELDASKSPIGIVFWVGDPTASDPTLKREYPDCTHGLVVSLHDVTGVIWQRGFASYNNTISAWLETNAPQYTPIISNVSKNSNLNKILGYNNSCAIKAFNAAPENVSWQVNCMSAIEQYAAKVPVAPTSSGWYLPSIKELALLFCGDYNGNIIDDMDPDLMPVINAAMQKLPSATPLDDYNDYLSSTEKDAHIIYDYSAGYVATSGCSKGTVNRMVRPVLAF